MVKSKGKKKFRVIDYDEVNARDKASSSSSSKAVTESSVNRDDSTENLDPNGSNELAVNTCEIVEKEHGYKGNSDLNSQSMSSRNYQTNDNHQGRRNSPYKNRNRNERKKTTSNGNNYLETESGSSKGRIGVWQEPSSEEYHDRGNRKSNFQNSSRSSRGGLENLTDYQRKDNRQERSDKSHNRKIENDKRMSKSDNYPERESGSSKEKIGESQVTYSEEHRNTGSSNWNYQSRSKSQNEEVNRKKKNKDYVKDGGNERNRRGDNSEYGKEESLGSSTRHSEQQNQYSVHPKSRNGNQAREHLQNQHDEFTKHPSVLNKSEPSLDKRISQQTTIKDNHESLDVTMMRNEQDSFNSYRDQHNVNYQPKKGLVGNQPYSGEMQQTKSKRRNDSRPNNVDLEFNQFWEEYRLKKIEYVKVVEKEQDLFTMPSEYALGHCVAEDMRMGSGIAVQFKRDFKEVDDLLNQRQKQGGLAFLELPNGRYIYYLVTKKLSTGKPTNFTIWSSLKKMRDHIRDNQVKKLAIPRIGCGLDRLEWSEVKSMIEFLFQNVDVEIVVCNFQQLEEYPPSQKEMPKIKLFNVNKPLVDIEEWTIIIYFSTEDGYITNEMKELDQKFHFLAAFNKASKRLGETVKFQSRNNYIFYGCIVRKTSKGPFDFKAFSGCLREINKANKLDKYEYVGVSAFSDSEDDVLFEKVVTILRAFLRNVDIYVCWYGDMAQFMPERFY